MVTLTTLDIVFIVAYFLLVILIAYVRTRKGAHEEYLIAGRKLGVLSTFATINATKTGAILLIYVALLYLYGFSAMWFFIGASAGYLLFIPFAVRLHSAHGAKHYTLADYFFHSYGKVSGYCASAINIFTMIAWLVLNLIAGSKVLSFFTGLSFEISAAIVAAIVLVYLLIGGFKAVVTTDILQYFAIMFILTIFAVFLLQGVTIPAADWNLGQAGAQNIFGFFLLGILIPFASPELWQRVYAAKDVITLKKGIFYSVIVYIIVAVILSLIGLAVKAQFPGLDPDTALVQGFAQLLPTGLIGLAVVVFFAAFMSSIDTYAYTASSSFVHDFLRLRKAKAVRAIKYALIVIVALGTIIAISIQDLILGSFIFASYVIILALPTLATWIKPTIKSTTISTAIVIGLIGLTILTTVDVIQDNVTPLIIIKSLGISIVGLIIGAIASKFIKRA